MISVFDVGGGAGSVIYLDKDTTVLSRYIYPIQIGCAQLRLRFEPEGPRGNDSFPATSLSGRGRAIPNRVGFIIGRSLT